MNDRPYDFYTHGASIWIDAPPERVWEIVSNLGSSAQWAGSGQVLSLRKTTEGPDSVGTVFEAQEKVGAKFKSLSRITEYDPPRHIAWLSTPSVMKNTPDNRWHRWSFTIKQDGGKTRLMHDVGVAKSAWPGRLFQLVGIVASGGMKTLSSGMDRTLANIKEQAEQKEPVPA